MIRYGKVADRLSHLAYHILYPLPICLLYQGKVVPTVKTPVPAHGYLNW
jgi:hypothetical protein